MAGSDDFLRVVAGVPTQLQIPQPYQFVRVSASSNTALSGLLTIDGVTLVAGDRVGVVANTNPIENGVYIAAAGAWTRAPSFNNALADGIQAGVLLYTQEGTNNSRVMFLLVSTGTLVIGTSPLIFVSWGPLVRSDAVEFEIKASAAFATSYAYSSEIDVRDYANIDVYIEVTNKGTNTQFSVQAQTTGQATATQWSDLVSDDDILDGATTPEPYTATFDIAGDTVTFRKALNFPKRGTKMRIGVTAPNADGAFRVYCIRNVEN